MALLHASGHLWSVGWMLKRRLVEKDTVRQVQASYCDKERFSVRLGALGAAGVLGKALRAGRGGGKPDESIVPLERRS